MVSANATPAATPDSLGVGELNVVAARNVATPPNPNAGLDQFLTTGADGSTLFDSASWQSTALANPAWNDAAWSDAAWSDAAWASSASTDAAWSDAAWSDAAWASAAWGDAAWSDAAWADAAWADTAGSDPAVGLTNVDATAGQIAQAEAALGLCDPSLAACTATGTP